MVNLTQRIEDCLASTGYHPDCAKSADEKFNAAITVLAKAGTPIDEIQKRVHCLCTDVALMQGENFKARLNFLSVVVGHLQARPEPNLQVADDGCGTGVDLFVLHSLLGEKISLTGVDIDENALSIARQRVPTARFVSDIGRTPLYDVIYSDFISTGENTVPEVAARGRKTFEALRGPGLVLQNTDAAQIIPHCQFFGRAFAKILPPQLLAKKDKNNYYLCRYEKD